MTEKNHSVRMYAEILRRKGRSVLDAQKMVDPPWYRQLTWNEAEERAFMRWAQNYAEKQMGVSAAAWKHDCWLFSLNFGLHRRDMCTQDQHDEGRERDLPRSKWLPVREAMRTMPKDQWPKG